MEIWKDITWYEWLYQVSNLWRVKSLYFWEKILKLHINHYRWWYLTIMLYWNWKPRRFRINRLVALHFIPNIHNKPEVNHIDWNKQNNKLSNLEWCTHKENEEHKWKNGLEWERMKTGWIWHYARKAIGSTHHLSIEIKMLINDKYHRTFWSIREAERETPYTQKKIRTSLIKNRAVCNTPDIKFIYSNK